MSTGSWSDRDQRSTNRTNDYLTALSLGQCYWYRIASAPWNNEWYAIANTFLNGDQPGGPTEHNTDFAVPDC